MHLADALIQSDLKVRDQNEHSKKKSKKKKKGQQSQQSHK